MDVGREDSNDDGMVELIEILDDDSKSQDAKPNPETSYSVNLDEDFDNISCSLIMKDPKPGTSQTATKKDGCIVEAMDCDIDDTITIVDSKEDATEESTFYVLVDKADQVQLVEVGT